MYGNIGYARTQGGIHQRHIQLLTVCGGQQGRIACHRILWKFRNRETEPTIFVTPRVNYGDKPEGGIDIAAVRETAEKFGGGREKAAWFLKNRTYVDDVTGGAKDTEAAKQVSQDMEDIL
jgi:hypothetical protein